mgnify:CR=1 FL=1
MKTKDATHPLFKYATTLRMGFFQYSTMKALYYYCTVVTKASKGGIYVDSVMQSVGGWAAAFLSHPIHLFHQKNAYIQPAGTHGSYSLCMYVCIYIHHVVERR